MFADHVACSPTTMAIYPDKMVHMWLMLMLSLPYATRTAHTRTHMSIWNTVDADYRSAFGL